jgi:hypothetical protein
VTQFEATRDCPDLYRGRNRGLSVVCYLLVKPARTFATIRTQRPSTSREDRQLVAEANTARGIGPMDNQKLPTTVGPFPHVFLALDASFQHSYTQSVRFCGTWWNRLSSDSSYGASFCCPAALPNSLNKSDGPAKAERHLVDVVLWSLLNLQHSAHPQPFNLRR